jgi:NTE family protein
MELHEAKMALRGLLMALPEELRNDPHAKLLERCANERTVTVAQVVYRNKPYEGSSKDYEFSRQAMLEHWQAGLADVAHCMARHRAGLQQRPQASATMVLENERETVAA